MSTSEPIVGELRAIAAGNGGVLRPIDVISAAKLKNSALHDVFEWNDNKAAHEYRLEQARLLIRRTVMLLEVEGEEREVRMFVSLTTERGDEGGYRELMVVLNSPSLKEQMLADALAEMQSFESKYAHLRELSVIFAAAKKVRSRVVAREKRAA